MCEQIFSFLDHPSVVALLKVQPIQSKYRLSDAFCVEHGTRLDRHISDMARECFSNVRERYSGENPNVIATSIQPECEDCRMARYHGMIRCPSCNDFAHHFDICGDCDAGPYCLGCGPEQVGMFYCEGCDDRVCQTCREKIVCGNCDDETPNCLACAKTFLINCVSRDEYLCGSCHDSACACSGCNKPVCEVCLYFGGWVDMHYCDTCDKHTSCEDCMNAVPSPLKICPDCISTTCKDYVNTGPMQMCSPCMATGCKDCDENGVFAVCSSCESSLCGDCAGTGRVNHDSVVCQDCCNS
jgi:hypothetical protein